MENWGRYSDRDFSVETTPSNLRMVDENSQKHIFFDAIRAGDLNAVQNILFVNPNLLNTVLFGFEGADVYELIKDSKTKRCYTYTGSERDGFFYPLHVASETGNKNMTLLLLKAGADSSLRDYRDLVAEQKCNGEALHAFYEIKGMFFDKKERYIGLTDREGRRKGQGSLFFKPEGYLSEERLLYRGGFKQGLYHGHGTLYFAGTDCVHYAGKFRRGLFHGKGIEFNKEGHRIYQGAFREGMREGKGEEFTDGVLTYKGEFLNNMKHGFGKAIYGEKSVYVGRFENNSMSGLGVYSHPNGDRYEGMFHNNRMDGPGSYYQSGLNLTGEKLSEPVIINAFFQKGRKSKELTQVFIPKFEDLPDLKNQRLLSSIVKNQYNQFQSNLQKEMEENDNEEEREVREEGDKEEEEVETEKDEEVNKDFEKISGKGQIQTDSEHNPKKGKGNDREKERGKEKVVVDKDWKTTLAKYCKLYSSEAKALGIENVSSFKSDENNKKTGKKKTSFDEDGDEDGDGGGEEDDGDEMDELNSDQEEEEEAMIGDVNGIHFVHFTALYVCYLYVYSAYKLFESRLTTASSSSSASSSSNSSSTSSPFPSSSIPHTSHSSPAYSSTPPTAMMLHTSLTLDPDFEAVYYLVMEAVEAYNDAWEREFTIQESILARPTVTTVEKTKLLFMTEKEKRNEEIQRQRAELAAKKGTIGGGGELNREREKTIQREALEKLENELTTLIIEEIEEKMMKKQQQKELKLQLKQQKQQQQILQPSTGSSSSLNHQNSNNHHHHHIPQLSTSDPTRRLSYLQHKKFVENHHHHSYQQQDNNENNDDNNDDDLSVEFDLDVDLNQNDDHFTSSSLSSSSSSSSSIAYGGIREQKMRDNEDIDNDNDHDIDVYNRDIKDSFMKEEDEEEVEEEEELEDFSQQERINYVENEFAAELLHIIRETRSVIPL